MKTELENAYIISAKNQDDSLKIENFEILNNKTVDFDYVQKIKINGLKKIIGLKKSVIEKNKEIIRLLENNIISANELVKLDTAKKEQYLTQVEYYEQLKEKENIYLKKIENEIAILTQEVVLIQAEFGQKEEKFELINYVFKGKINSKNRIDTLTVLKNAGNEIKFIKNNEFSNYKGE